MKKHSISQQSPKGRRNAALRSDRYTIGMDLGDKTSRYWVLEKRARWSAEGSVATTKKAMSRNFGARPGAGSRWRWERIRRG